MSAFALVVHLDDSPVEEGLFQRVFATLDHRGPDGRRAIAVPGGWLGHQHFRSTPEEEGEEQPLVARRAGLEDPLVVAFDGRLDNRGDLCGTLGTATGDPTPSDATLVLWAYRRWGEAFLERLLGPFALVLVDRRHNRVVCGRDALGDRSLVYHLAPRLLVAASEERALLAHPAVSGCLNEGTLARFFAVYAPAPGATFFADIRELPPGHGLSVEGETVRMWRTWHPPAPGARPHAPGERVERFRDTLAAAVHCRLRSPQPAAVAMSGGLDSTAVAALAATELEAAGSGPLATVSWVFDELVECDERRYMDEMVERHGLAAARFPGDGAWPLSVAPPGPAALNAPLESLYHALESAAYAATREVGARTLLTGHYGDLLYLGGSAWLRDLVGRGHLGLAARGLLTELKEGRRAAARAALGRLVGRKRSAAEAPPWLTPFARRCLDAGPAPGSAASPGSLEAPGPLDPANAQGARLQAAAAARAGVDLRFPYRDRRLVELALELPASAQYRPGTTKWVLRQAMDGLLPEAVRWRRRPTTLAPLAARGLAERELTAARRLLAHPEALWRRYVAEEWLEEAFPGILLAGDQGRGALVPWRCLCAELWWRALQGEDTDALLSTKE